MNYKIYRFTFVDGKTREGAAAKWPVFDVNTDTTGHSEEYFARAPGIYQGTRMRLYFLFFATDRLN
jgi:hypothetical protein